MSIESTTSPVWLVNLSYFSSVWVALVATAGLLGVIYTRRQIIEAATRSTTVISLELNRDFSQRVEPMLQAAYHEMDAKNLPSGQRPPTPEYTRQELGGICTPAELTLIDNLCNHDLDFESALCRVMNEFEVHAIAYRAKAADPMLGYAGYGTVLIDFVDKAYVYIAYNRNANDAPASRPWEEALALAATWSKLS